MKNVYKHSYFPRTIDDWNRPPHTSTSALREILIPKTKTKFGEWAHTQLKPAVPVICQISAGNSSPGSFWHTVDHHCSNLSAPFKWVWNLVLIHEYAWCFIVMFSPSTSSCRGKLSLRCWPFAWLNDCANGNEADFMFVQTQKTQSL